MKYQILLTILSITLLFTACKETQNNKVIKYKPIGYISSKYTLQTGAPRQGTLVPDSKGIIILDTVYTKALQELDEFEYIWILYHFNQSKGWDLTVNPPKSTHQFGVFATRSPRRPNAIGLSLVKIDTIINNKIYIHDVDAFDGTPVLDIKPFLPSVDFRLSKKNGEAERFLGHHDKDFIESDLMNKFVLGK